MDKNIIIGIGNLLFFDDGIGVIATKYLSKNFSFNPEVEILDGGTLGFNIINYLIEYDNVFIIDTISTDAEAGEIYKIPYKELLGSNGYKNTAHEVELIQMLELCEIQEKKANITVFGIVAENIDNIEIGLSRTLKNSFHKLIETIVLSIEEKGIKGIKNGNYNLDDIIKELDTKNY